MKKWNNWIVLSLFFTSCEKDIDFELSNQPPVLVVDGVIEDGLQPRIILTKTANYFSAITPQIAANLFIHNATITIDNGTANIQLKEYETNLGGGYKLYHYTCDTAMAALKMFGEQNKTYHLKITADGKDYQSTTIIPLLAKKCDSLWWKSVPNNPDTSLTSLVGKFTDPPGLGNYIRYFTRVNSNSFLPGENSAFDDQVIDGKTYSVQIDQGIDRNSIIDEKTKGFFHRGDTVTLKFCNTDRATYQFWNTWEFAYLSVGNPFSTPNKVIGNISNGALGAFCGYSVDYKKLIIPK